MKRIRKRSIPKAFGMLIISLLIIISVNAATVSHPANQVSPGSFGSGDYLFPANLTVSNALTVATINTGNGAYEVNSIAGYYGNQDLRTTDNPTFGALTAATIDTGYGAKEIGDSVGNCASTEVHKGDGGCEAESSLSVASASSATTATTASDLSCTNCIGPTEIADNYVLNTGDTIAGSLTVSSGNLAISNGVFSVARTGGESYISINTDNTYKASLLFYEGGAMSAWINYNGATNYLQAINTNNGVYLSSGATAWSALSDERLKKNVTNIDNALEKLEQINGVYFYWKNESLNQDKQVGVIAQEIERVLPEIVSESDYKGVQYSLISPLLIEAVKELKQEKDNEILRHEFEIEMLRAENTMLKQALCEEFPEKVICQN